MNEFRINEIQLSLLCSFFLFALWHGSTARLTTSPCLFSRTLRTKNDDPHSWKERNHGPHSKRTQIEGSSKTYTGRYSKVFWQVSNVKGSLNSLVFFQNSFAYACSEHYPDDLPSYLDPRWKDDRQQGAKINLNLNRSSEYLKESINLSFFQSLFLYDAAYSRK